MAEKPVWKKAQQGSQIKQNFLGWKEMKKAFKNRKSRCVVHFYFKISTERQVRFFVCFFFWKLVGLFTDAKWNSFISWGSCHPDKALLNAVKPDFGFWFGTHSPSSQALSCFSLRNFNLQVSDWKVLKGHSHSVNNFTRLLQFKTWKITFRFKSHWLHQSARMMLW